MVLHIDTRYGGGIGTSNATHILADDGREYLIKGPSLSPGHQYGAVNEFVAASLARELGLPVLDFDVVEDEGDYFFGSSWMPSGTFSPAVTENAFLRCRNLEQVYELVSLDIWLCNIDRHDENLIVRETRGPGGIGVAWTVNDHDRCLIRPGETPADLLGKVGWDSFRNFVRLSFVRDAIREAHRLSAALGRVEAVSDLFLLTVVGSLPPELLPVDGRVHVEQFLRDRRDGLRNLVRIGRRFFGNLDGGRI